MAIEDIKTPKSIILPTPEKIGDEETKLLHKKLMSAIDNTHKKLHEDIKTLHRILAGTDAMANALDMGSNKITNLTDCTANQDGATKKYVDDNLPVAGLWEVDGSEHQLITADEIDMQSKKILNLLAGASGLDAVNYTQLDAKAAKGANADITSLTGLTTPLSTAQGGTGKGTLLYKTTAYTGNGNDDRDVAHGLGVTPTLVLIICISDAVTVATHWATGMALGRDINAATNRADALQAVDATNVQLGTSGWVNQDTKLYIMHCFGTQT